MLQIATRKSNRTMTHNEWLRCSEADKMIDHILANTQTNIIKKLLWADYCRMVSRKKRLFICACCRSLWGELPPYGQEAVSTAEAFADGQVNAAAMRRIHLKAERE